MGRIPARGGTQQMRPGAQYGWGLARFSKTRKMYVPQDVALRKPNLEPDVGFPSGGGL